MPSSIFSAPGDDTILWLSGPSALEAHLNDLIMGDDFIGAEHYALSWVEIHGWPQSREFFELMRLIVPDRREQQFYRQMAAECLPDRPLAYALAA